MILYFLNMFSKLQNWLSYGNRLLVMTPFVKLTQVSDLYYIHDNNDELCAYLLYAEICPSSSVVKLHWPSPWASKQSEITLDRLEV